MSQSLYTVRLTWDEMIAAMSACSQRARHLQQIAGTDDDDTSTMLRKQAAEYQAVYDKLLNTPPSLSEQSDDGLATLLADS